MGVLVIYDDSNPKSEVICDVIGSEGFANVVVKKKLLSDYYKEVIKSTFPTAEWLVISSKYEIPALLDRLNEKNEDMRVIHCFSHFIISTSEKAVLSLEKISYIDNNYKMIADNNCAGIMFYSIVEYRKFLKQLVGNENYTTIINDIENFFEIEGLVNIGNIENFIQCITGNFDSRYFNSLKGNEYTLVKSSTNKKKIKAEYMYYHLLPDDMKMWFVMPFEYKEDEKVASYKMERLHTTDLAIRWVHKSISLQEMESILEKYFYFFSRRHKKEVSEEEYNHVSKNLYEEKVKQRIDGLVKLVEYRPIENLLLNTVGMSIYEIYEKYIQLKHRIEKKTRMAHYHVIGHGDPCFANTMYNRSTSMLKFIDPKGALDESELWTNPYYDVAKLSHSICGRYDFFNNALFEISINSDMKSELQIDFDNLEYKQLFQNVLGKNGYDYWLIRTYEASLFISMLPLHMDYPQKVYGFILNAISILEEIEKNV